MSTEALHFLHIPQPGSLRRSLDLGGNSGIVLRLPPNQSR